MRKDLLIACGVVALAVPDILGQGFMGLLYISLFVSAFFMIQEERGFCLLCAGIPSAIAAGLESPVRALLILILLTGLLLREKDLLSERRELKACIIFSGAAGLSVLVLGTFRHAALPIIILGVLSAIAALLIWISESRLKWRYEHEEEKI